MSQSRDRLQSIVDAFRSGGGAGKPVYLQVKLSYATDEDTALREAHEQWATNVVGAELSEDISTPHACEALAERVSPEQVAQAVHVSADIDRHLQWLQDYIDMGFDALFLHNVNTRQSPFIDAFARDVLPRLRR